MQTKDPDVRIVHYAARCKSYAIIVHILAWQTGKVG